VRVEWSNSAVIKAHPSATAETNPSGLTCATLELEDLNLALPVASTTEPPGSCSSTIKRRQAKGPFSVTDRGVMLKTPAVLTLGCLTPCAVAEVGKRVDTQ